MAELNLKQITDKLNAEFSGETRKLVFWYDDAAEFAEDIGEIELENAKLYKLERDNQFYTKHFFECVDTTTNYLIYAPFPKPPVRENHLEDTIKYSKRFLADKASLLCVDLGISEELKPVIQKHMKFFDNKDRTNKFYQLEIEKFNQSLFEIALMSVLCKARTASFDEVVRAVLMEGVSDDNKYMVELNKYGLCEAFWQLCEEQYGYHEVSPSIKKLTITFFITYTAHFMHAKVPAAWNGFVSFKSGTIIAFMDNVMNNVLFRETYDDLSKKIGEEIKAKKYLAEVELSDLFECDTFTVIDDFIIKWVTANLMSENLDASLAEKNIMAVCGERTKRHFGELYHNQYQLLYNAFWIINAGGYTCPSTLDGIVEQYRNTDCLIDSHYRNFYTCYDRIERTENFEPLRELVENIYTNEYLDKITTRWNDALSVEGEKCKLPLQRNFYQQYVSNVKERVVVIISDAFRYEVARDLWGKLDSDEKCTAKLDMMLGVLPSFTKLGMASLLPHKELEITDDLSDTKFLIDGKPCDSTVQREQVLQRANPNSCCVSFETLLVENFSNDVLRKYFQGKSVVYVYHDEIDTRGEKPKTENEVFVAAKEAIDEIYKLIKRATEGVSATRFLVTADHGFIYKRDKIQESDKIDGLNTKENFVNKRFIISAEPIAAGGTKCYGIASILGNHDTKSVTVPYGTSIFKAPGGGQNFVHGGASPQEMLIPVIDVRTQKGHMDTRPAPISLVSITQKVTNLILSLDFIQSEPVSDVVKQTTYKLFFVSDDNEKISNECAYVADSKDKDAQKRVFRLKFTFKNKKYDRSRKYALVAYDMGDELNEPIWSHDVVMDLAFADDFGF